MTNGATQLPLDLEHRPALGTEDFIVAPCNSDAVRWLDRWPDWPGPALALYGPAAAGKTHLAKVWQQRTGARELPPEALHPETIHEHLPSPAVVVEDAGTVRDEVAFLHLYNVVREAGGHILLTDPLPPARWSTRLPDLRSRLAAAPAVAIRSPDDALLSAVLAKLFRDRQLRVGEDVVRFLMLRMERSFEAARRLVDVLDRRALAEGRAVTVRLARDVMQGR